MEDGVLACLLEALEKTPPLSNSPISAELIEASKEPIEGQWKYPFHLVRHAAIEVIKSGIFLGDSLKGKSIPSVPPKFVTYPISDPEELIWLIALPLGKDVEKEINQKTINFFQTGIHRCLGQMEESMICLSGVIEPWAKSRTKDQIKKINGLIGDLKRELWASLPKDSFKLDDPMNYLFGVIKKHVPPKTPHETIAKRVTEIIQICFGITVSYRVILQRQFRKGQRTT